MPLAAAGVGFTVTLGLLFTLWALMCYTALLLLEVYQHVPADMGLGSLAARYLGRYGQWVTGFCMLFLLYALTAAYISGAGELLASSLNQWLDWQLPPAAGVLIFTLLGGAVVCIGTALVDLFNRFLFSAKIVFLVIMLALLMPHIHQVNLLTLPVEQGGPVGHSGDFHLLWFSRQRPEHRQLSGGGYSQIAPGIYHRQLYSSGGLYFLAAGDAGQYRRPGLYRHAGK